MMPNSPNSAYMACFKLFEKNGHYHAYMVREIQGFHLVEKVESLFKTPEELSQYTTAKTDDKRTKSIHLYEAWNDTSSSNRHEDITFTSNRIKIDFHSVEDDPCYFSMFWNICLPNGMSLDSYIGGSALIVDMNDGRRGKNISAFKMGLEAIESIPSTQKKIIDKGPLLHDSIRVIQELTLDSVDGRMTLDNGDDNRWFHFIQNDTYRGTADHRYDDVNVEHLISSLVRLKADYERQLDDLKNTIKDLKEKL